MRIRLDDALCVGHGRCYELAPEVFGEDAAGRCQIRLAEVPVELEDKARLGEASCPEGAIRIEGG